MKIALQFALTLFLSATFTFSTQAASRTLNLNSFSGIALTSNFNVVLKQGSKQKVTVNGPSEIINKMNTSISNGTWKVYSNYKSKNKNWSKEKVTVYVTMTKLNYISLSGSGNIDGSSFNTGDLTVKLTGSGNLKIGATSRGKVTTTLAGSGNINLSGSAKSMTAKITGSGNCFCKKYESV